MELKLAAGVLQSDDFSFDYNLYKEVQDDWFESVT